MYKLEAISKKEIMEWWRNYININFPDLNKIKEEELRSKKREEELRSKKNEAELMNLLDEDGFSDQLHEEIDLGDQELLDLIVDLDDGIFTSSGRLNGKFLKIMAIEMGYLRKP